MKNQLVSWNRLFEWHKCCAWPTLTAAISLSSIHSRELSRQGTLKLQIYKSEAKKHFCDFNNGEDMEDVRDADVTLPGESEASARTEDIEVIMSYDSKGEPLPFRHSGSVAGAPDL